ncbi:hypothetical protein B566_EDAN015864 [Ephemera danica]|nr:hypothetical protein B566_EDAN015864 [Ephemera danica]
MESSVARARARLRMFPRLLAECAGEGKSYARCVAQQDNPQRGACAREFEQLSRCVRTAAQKRGTRI